MSDTRYYFILLFTISMLFLGFAIGFSAGNTSKLFECRNTALSLDMAQYNTKTGAFEFTDDIAIYFCKGEFK